MASLVSTATDSQNTWNEPEYSGPPSRLQNRLQEDLKLKYSFQRDVSAEVAEQLIRLRKYRGKSQSELAAVVGTSQSAIARHEHGVSNMRLSTLNSLLEGLNAVIRIDLIPEEHCNLYWNSPRWWIALDGARRSATGKYAWACAFQANDEEGLYSFEPSSEEASSYPLLAQPAHSYVTRAVVADDEPQEIQWLKVPK